MKFRQISFNNILLTTIRNKVRATRCFSFFLPTWNDHTEISVKDFPKNLHTVTAVDQSKLLE